MDREQQAARMAKLLGNQVDLYKGLVGLARNKRKSLVDNDLESLEKLIEAEQVLLWRAARMEDERLMLQEQIVEEMGLASDCTLTEIMARLNGTDSEEFSELAVGLRQVFAELESLNRENSALITESLSQIDLSLRALTKLSNGNDTYNTRGTTTGNPSPYQVVDSKA